MQIEADLSPAERDDRLQMAVLGRLLLAYPGAGGSLARMEVRASRFSTQPAALLLQTTRPTAV